MADFGNLGPADQLKFEGMLLGMSFRELSQLLEPRSKSRGGGQQAAGGNPLAALAGILPPQPQPSPPSPLPASIPPQLAQLLSARLGQGGVPQVRNPIPAPPPRPLGAF